MQSSAFTFLYGTTGGRSLRWLKCQVIQPGVLTNISRAGTDPRGIALAGDLAGQDEAEMIVVADTSPLLYLVLAGQAASRLS